MSTHVAALMTTQNPVRLQLKRIDVPPFWQRRTVRATLVFVLAALIRIPYQATYLVNWDSVNFALGVESFNLENHQPHPPGYLGYVLLGRLIDWLVGDPVAALTGLSVVAGAAATMWVYVLGTRLVNERAALIAAALFGSSPLVWYYSEVPLSYIVEVALALPLVILVLEVRRQKRPGLFAAATVVLALMGAVRQTSLVFFLPLWIYGWLVLSRRARLANAVLLGALVASWLIPLLMLSGGLENYVRLSLELAELTGGATWLGAGAGVLRNFLIMGTALVLGMHVALLAIPLHISANGRSQLRSSDHRRFLFIWGLPPLATYLLIHSGQLGYVLVLLPIPIIWAAGVFDRTSVQSVLKPALVGLLVAVNAAGFFVLPEIAYATVGRGRVTVPEQMASNVLVQRGIQQASIPRNDAHWESLIGWIETHDHDEVVVLAEPRDGGSFRHLSFYLPDYRIYGLGLDKDGALGHLFTGVGHRIDYSIDQLEDASSRLDFPGSVGKVLIPDLRLQQRLATTFDLTYVTLRDGSRMAVAEVPRRSWLAFFGAYGTPLLLPGEGVPTGMVGSSALAAGVTCSSHKNSTPLQQIGRPASRLVC